MSTAPVCESNIEGANDKTTVVGLINSQVFDLAVFRPAVWRDCRRLIRTASASEAHHEGNVGSIAQELSSRMIRGLSESCTLMRDWNRATQSASIAAEGRPGEGILPRVMTGIFMCPSGKSMSSSPSSSSPSLASLENKGFFFSGIRGAPGVSFA